MQQQYNFTIDTLGEPRYESPLKLSTIRGDSIANFTNENERVFYSIEINQQQKEVDTSEYNTLEIAGPRKSIYFNPSQVHAGIVTCGGLCPGLNDVIRAVVRTLWESYGVHKITGITYGYNGFLGKYKDTYMPLDRSIVENLHLSGGSFLGASRGGGDIEKIVDEIQKLGINMIYIVGGDGTQKGASLITKESKKRNYDLAVIGIPKTIDNDLCFIDRSFGFETAVTKATEAVVSAHQEAESAYNGVGLVKLMGRNSGFIAAYAALASHEANFVLIPEVKFDLHGDNGFLKHLERRLMHRQHAVVVVAEGAGMNHFDNLPLDASGNISFNGPDAPDIGMFLSKEINKYFKEIDTEVTVKYINPSYMIRSSVALPTDSLYCTRLAASAVHAGMAGKTGMMISLYNGHYVHLPIEVVISEINTLDPESTLWRDIIAKLRMPASMTNDESV